jgi:hypothetical protein
VLATPPTSYSLISARQYGVIMTRKSLLFVASVVAALSGTNVLAAERETVIQERNGDRTLIHTDGKGTTVTRAGRLIYNAGGDRHQEQVDHSTKDGGKVISDKR